MGLKDLFRRRKLRPLVEDGDDLMPDEAHRQMIEERRQAHIEALEKHLPPKH